MNLRLAIGVALFAVLVAGCSRDNYDITKEKSTSLSGTQPTPSSGSKSQRPNGPPPELKPQKVGEGDALK